MRRSRILSLAVASALILAMATPGFATPTEYNSVPSNGKAVYVQLPNGHWVAQQGDSSGNGNTAGTFSASIGGFISSTSGSRMTPITVGTSDSSGTLPAGSVVVVTNAGATLMYCNARGVAATASDQPIAPSGGWFAFTISGGITTLHCISTGSGTTANGLGGDGIPTGTGGGSGGGSGGAVTVADGADVTQGFKADAANCATANSLIACIRQLHADLIAAQPAFAAIPTFKVDQTTPGTTDSVTLATGQGAGATIGTTSGAAQCADATGTIHDYMRCLAKNSTNTIPVIASGVSTAVIGCDKTAIYDASTSGSTELVALTSTQTIYVCGYVMRSSTTAVNGELDYGTGTACATGNTKMTPAFQMTTYDGQSDPSAFYRGMKTAVSSALCFKASAAQPVQLLVYYTKY